jgi:2',3'-cyclic-nucleotide 2'-phosphodiesterase (5'-nucleotidase family)
LLLDAGDAVSAGNLGYRVGGEPVLAAMSELGYDAMCIGNRETHPRREIFPRKVDRATFPLLCANARAKQDAPLPTQPFVILRRDETAVGVLGVTVAMFTKKQWSQPLCDYFFEPPIDAARVVAAQLRPQVDLLIALTHIGHSRDLELASACPELDLVIGGHSHTRLTGPVWVGQVPVVQAYAFGFLAGVAQFSTEPVQPRLREWWTEPLRDDLPEV